MLVVLTAARASSADDDAERIATARALGVEGVTLADAGKCDQAIERLVRAEALHHAPTTQERLGECHVALGHLVVGTEILHQVVREPLSPSAPAPFVAAQTRARAVLEKALPRIGTLRVHVEGPGGRLEDVAVRIDGEPVASAMLDVDRPTDPGDHMVEAGATGRRGASAATRIAEGAHETVSLVLQPEVVEPPAPSVVPPPAPAPPSAPKPGPSDGPPRWIGWTLGGIGVVGLAVGSIFGARTFSDKSTLESECTGTRCPSGASSDVSAASRDATIANVAFGAGAALVAGGVVLLLLHPSPPSPAQARIGPSVGPGWAGVQGAF